MEFKFDLYYNNKYSKYYVYNKTYKELSNQTIVNFFDLFETIILIENLDLNFYINELPSHNNIENLLI